MTYIELINQFWKINKEKSISATETQLYFKLLDTCNALGWKNPFNHSNRFVCGETNVSEKTLIRARRNLKHYGLIDFKSGKLKKQNTIYSIVGITNDSHNVPLSGPLNGPLNAPLSGPQSGSQSSPPGNPLSGTNAPDNIRSRLDKELDKEKNENKEPKGSMSTCVDSPESVSEVFNQFNLICKNVIPAKVLTKKRKETIGARLREHGFENVLTMLELAGQSDFMAGDNKRKWMATIDWVFRPTNFVKVLEGNYNNRPDRSPGFGPNTGYAGDYIGKPSHLEIIKETYQTLVNDGTFDF